jgi:prepilin-type N-terminal cleavage/methylation domain-containing protein
MALAKFSWIVRRPSVAGGQRAGEHGFSLLEVLCATTILTTAVVGLAQLFAVSTRANTGARATTFSAVLAQQKMEQLRGLTWGFDSIGLPLTDTSTNTTSAAETATGGNGLTPSPAGVLGANTNGYCDFLNANGLSLGGGTGGTTPPTGAVYTRRWSIEPLPTNPNNTLVLQVLTMRHGKRIGTDATINTRRLPDEARIVSVKTRKAI